MLGGLVAFVLLGPLMYYLSSPFVLFYAYILLGSDLQSLGEGLRARQHLRRQFDIAATNPRDSDAHYQIGLIYQQRHQYDEAKRRFTRAMEIDAKEADPVFQLGRIALDEERFGDAIDLLSRAAALDDKCCSHEVWRDLGVAYFRSGRLKEAQLALGKYVERRAYDPEGLYWYGKSLLALGQVNDARQQFEECREAVETMQPNRRRQLAKWKRMAKAELKDIEKTTV
jgi:tetratricopeptide (TPR) repeat protein